MVVMSTIDSSGRVHRARNTAGAGQFTSLARSAPDGSLEAEPEFDEVEWTARMAAIIDEGEPESLKIAGADGDSGFDAFRCGTGDCATPF